ncbi:MAG TPA: preprotein translocase subunit SecG [Epulopiscium sp.]|nr:preprotein translocase subunit SecG [Candidatus Epulonipiscium sp.]
MATLKMIMIAVYLIAAFAIIGIVLMQEGKSAGLGSLSGASNNAGGDSYWGKIKGRSLEGKLQKWTQITAGLFLLSALILMVIK